MKTTLYLRSFTLIVAASILAVNVLANIKNVKVDRQADLAEQGGNLLIFRNQINYETDGSEQYYYYAIAKDY